MFARSIALCLSALGILALSSARFPAVAQQTPPSQPSSTQMAEMMKRHQQMMGGMTAADDKLDQLVKEMNAATGDAKIAAIARVVTELAEQQKFNHGRMGSMNNMMMMMGGRGMMMGGQAPSTPNK